MSELSGVVAVLAAPGGAGAAIIDIRNLGPDPVPVKPNRVIPVVDVKPALGVGQRYGTPTITHDGVTATRTYPVEAIPTPAGIDQATLNEQLIEDGSVVRGLALVMLDEINLLRQQAGLSQRTLNQLKTAIQNKMR